MDFSSVTLKGTTSQRAFSNVQRSGSCDRKKMASQNGVSDGDRSEVQVLVTVHLLDTY